MCESKQTVRGISTHNDSHAKEEADILLVFRENLTDQNENKNRNALQEG